MNNILNQNLKLKGKKVVLRVDLNVPMKNGAITETSRIKKILPTLNSVSNSVLEISMELANY